MNVAERVLVVDDNPATLHTTSRVLKSAGFDVIPARSGTEALAALDSSIRLVVLDVNLPDIDGFEIVRRIRANPATRRLPVVHLSASFVTEMAKVEGLASGADGYLTHPVEPLVLIGTINAFLRARRAEEDLRRSEAKFRAVFDFAPSGIALLDDQLRFMDLNPAMCGLLGRPREELVGVPAVEHLHPEDRGLTEELEPVLQRDGQWRGVLRVNRPDGQVAHLEWHVSGYPEPGMRLAVTTDVTERRESETEREALLASERAARGDAERANRVKDEFLATLSHELRNPLNAILGWASTLRRRYPEGDVAVGLETVERNARAQARLISDLLDVSSITSGKLRLDPRSVDLNDVVYTAIEAQAPSVAAKQLRLVRELPTRSSWVWGDPARLEQIVWNLVNNAVKFTPRGGTVTVSVRQLGPEVELCVQDTGKGIAPEFIPHMFERFRQEDASTTRTYSGLGLGLAIVDRLVGLHQGTVRAYSEGEGKGAMFVVRLPVGAEVPFAKDDFSAEDVPLDGLDVLVVEDDDDARVMIRRVLEEAGARVRDAADVDTALQRVEDAPPDVLVSDIGMAGIDGYELMRRLRQQEAFRAMPAVALTAFARAQDRDDALRAGYQLHLAKPIDPQRLVLAIARLVRPQA